MGDTGDTVGDTGDTGTRGLTPEVMMTDWKRSKTGLMAMEASMQLGGDTHPWGDTATPTASPHAPRVPPGVPT